MSERHTHAHTDNTSVIRFMNTICVVPLSFAVIVTSFLLPLLNIFLGYFLLKLCRYIDSMIFGVVDMILFRMRWGR